jgi:hypothetical protein
MRRHKQKKIKKTKMMMKRMRKKRKSQMIRIRTKKSRRNRPIKSQRTTINQKKIAKRNLAAMRTRLKGTTTEKSDSQKLSHKEMRIRKQMCLKRSKMRKRLNRLLRKRYK